VRTLLTKENGESIRIPESIFERQSQAIASSLSSTGYDRWSETRIYGVIHRPNKLQAVRILTTRN
jgi:hypothetical protein